MDKFSVEKRSKIMARIRSHNTKPELIVRSMLHKAGFRFRVNKKTLPGKPDIVLAKYKTVIFVHGCFWHSHPGCRRASLPQTNTEFWKEKLEKNKLRDEKEVEELKELGWSVVIVWTCQLKDKNSLMEKLLLKLKEKE
ncbi:very short patch repair endonuclease [Anaeroarcus burkinensis]|uniref:very short patch repair endonuclease n=1 Tax=Anaeroarcus burkinensis TaxID=82376 RepID=UPI002475B4EB|nr:DNA mismatch endonuclease Vsr [Anaeroarcus burkinensis]